MQPEAAWTSGSYNYMPIMGGSTRDELTMDRAIAGYFSGPLDVPLRPGQYSAGIKSTWGRLITPLVLAEYPLSKYGNDTEMAYNRVSTDPLLCRALTSLKRRRPQIEETEYTRTTSLIQMRLTTSL